MSSNPLLTTRCARWLALLERTARGTAPWRPSPRYVPRYHPRPRAPDVPLQRDVQGGTARDARLGRAKRDRQGRAPSQEPLRGGARAVERGDGPALLPRDARAPYAGGVRSGQPATPPGRGRARALQRGGRGSALPAVRTDLGPAAQPPPAPRVRRSRGPERPASGATAARCLARGRPPPPRRPLRPLPPGRGGPTFGP